MKKIIEILFRLLSKDYEMDANTQEVCRYGLDIFLYTLVSTFGLLAIGAIFRRMIGSIIYIILFILTKPLAEDTTRPVMGDAFLQWLYHLHYVYFYLIQDFLNGS